MLYSHICDTSERVNIHDCVYRDKQQKLIDLVLLNEQYDGMSLT